MFFMLVVAAAALACSARASVCICTTVVCPTQGKNTITMGNGHANIEYTYQLHGNHAVVVSATGTIDPASLDTGTGTTTCTQEYSRMLEDDGYQNCDAGHILANRLGGYGNEPINIFPQLASVNRGIYAQFEGNIYECMQTALHGKLTWEFKYDGPEKTMPASIHYTAAFDGGNCTTLNSFFPNYANQTETST